jgi:protein TonB
MNGIARDAEDTSRLALALLLALGLHAALLLGIPAESWSIRYPRPLRFDVALLPPIERPTVAAPTAAAPASVEPQPPTGPAAAAVLPKPALLPKEPPPVAPPSPAPVLAPRPAIPPPKPVAAIRPAPKPTAPAKPLVKPPATAKITPTPRMVAPRAMVKPVAPSKPAQPLVAPAKPARPPQTAVVEPLVKPPVVKPSPPPQVTPAETRQPVGKPPASPPERSKRGGGARTGTPGRLDSAALLGQIAGLDAETQRRASGGAREKRVSLADTRSLAGFYAADWARKVTRIGEMNFPDAARRLDLSAGPLLDVAIRADGSLRDVRILRSSGNAELDRAARRIVELAAPYPPFPPELRQQVELLHIEAPWRFDPGGRVRVR